MEVIFLGTGGSMPTKNRGLPSVLVRRGAELFMLDCGEGCQKGMLMSKAGFNRKMKILVSHLHGDHVLGLPGLLHTMAFLGRTEKLEIYAPAGIAQFIEGVNKAVPLRNTFPIEVHEVGAGVVFEGEEYVIRSAWAKHSAPCLAYSIEERPRPGKFYPERARKLNIPEGPLWKLLQRGKPVSIGGRTVKPQEVLGPPRKGLKVTYAVDTRPCNDVVRLAKNSDLLIHDSTFAEDAKGKAREYFHSTAKEAAKLAARSRSSMLALFHISAMYKDASLLLKEAREVFPNVVLPDDMDTIRLRYKD